MKRSELKGNVYGEALGKQVGFIALCAILLMLALLTFLEIDIPLDVSFQPNADVETIIDKICDEVPIEQVFTATTDSIASVDVMVGTYRRINQFSLILELREEATDALLTVCEMDTSRLVDNAYQRVDFSPISVTPGGQYRLIFRAEGANTQNTIAFYRTGDGTADNENYAQLNGAVQSYSLAVKVYSYRSRLASFLNVVAVLFVAVATVGICIVTFNKSIKMECVFAGLAVGIGFFYLVTITPVSAPDELHHYQSSYHLSNYFLFHWDALEYGDVQDFDYTQFAGHQNVSSGYMRVMNELGGKTSEGESILIPQPRELSYFIEYLPQALGITLARIFNLNFTTTFLIGRLFNLLFYAVCLYFAVKRTPKFKLVIGLIGVMPMSLHQAASYSYDGFINGMAFVLIASILKAIYEKDNLGRIDYLWILVSGMLLAPAKVIYSAILLLCVLIPQDRFSGKQQKFQRIALMLTMAATFIVLFQLSRLGSMVAGGDGLNWEGQHNYTLSFVFHHPLQTAEIFFQTIIKYWNVWFYCTIGSSLSGLSLPIPTWIINIFVLVILLSVLSQADESESLLALHRCSFLFVFNTVLLLAMASMFLSWTSDTRPIIQGVQGRYLIPVFPLLIFALNNKNLVLRRNIDKELIIVSVLLHGNVISNILSYTLQH